MKWPKTNEGDQARVSAIGWLKLKQSGMADTQSNVTDLREIRIMIAKNQILNTHQKFWLPHEIGEKREQLIKMYGWTTDGGSITDRMGITIGIDHEDMLKRHIAFDDVDRKNYADFGRLVGSIENRIKGVLSKYNLWSEFNLLKVELMLEDRFWDGIKDGKTASQLVNPNDPNFIFKDLEDFIPTLQEEAKQVAETYSSNEKGEINTEGEITKVEAPDSYPKRDLKIFPNNPEGNDAWLKSEILNQWIWQDYPENTIMSIDAKNFFQTDLTPPEIMAGYSKKDKIKKMETAATSVERDAIELDIEYHLVPPRPEEFKGKNWVGVYKKENKDAVTLEELEKIVSKEKLHRFTEKRKKLKTKAKDQTKTIDKDRIKQKVLDFFNEKRFDKRDGVYYYKGTNIKVDARVLE